MPLDAPRDDRARVWPHVLLLAPLALAAALLGRWALRTATEEQAGAVRCDQRECVVEHADGSPALRVAVAGLQEAYCRDEHPQLGGDDAMRSSPRPPQRQLLTVSTATDETVLYRSAEPGPRSAKLWDACRGLSRFLQGVRSAEPSEGSLRVELPPEREPGTAARGLARGLAVIGLLALGVVASGLRRRSRRSKTQ